MFKYFKLIAIYLLLLSSILIPTNSHAVSEKKCVYSEIPPYQLLSQTEPDGKFVTYSYAGQSSLKVAEFIGANSKILQRHQYTYDSHERLINLIIDDGSSDNIKDLKDVINRRVISFSYSSSDSQRPTYAEETHYKNQSGLFVATSHIIHDDPDLHLKSVPAPAPPSDSFWDWAKDIFNSVGDQLNDFKKQNSYENYIKNDLDLCIEQIIGRGYLQFAGYYTDVAEVGCTKYGKEVHDKVRITLINGILNIRSDMEIILKTFSDTHGNIPIHYVFRPTEGWTKDILISSLSKLGFTSTSAELLAGTWKKLIQDMGGVNGGGIIVHYAHSIGATDTYVARNLMTPEELKMIHVRTLGSPTMIPTNSGFASIINYASLRDGVCYLDPIGFSTGLFHENSQIKFIGSFWGIPFIDHTLYTESYGGLITELGVSFKDLYHNIVD